MVLNNSHNHGRKRGEETVWSWKRHGGREEADQTKIKRTWKRSKLFDPISHCCFQGNEKLYLESCPVVSRIILLLIRHRSARLHFKNQFSIFSRQLCAANPPWMSANIRNLPLPPAYKRRPSNKPPLRFRKNDRHVAAIRKEAVAEVVISGGIGWNMWRNERIPWINCYC